MTYRDIEQEALAAEAIREHNVVAMGDGEKPDRWTALWRHTEATRKRNRDNAAQAREWQQARPGCTGQLCSECSMSDEDCADYSESLHSAGREAHPPMTAQGLEIAGAHTPRCDH